MCIFYYNCFINFMNKLYILFILQKVVSQKFFLGTEINLYHFAIFVSSVTVRRHVTEYPLNTHSDYSMYLHKVSQNY